MAIYGVSGSLLVFTSLLLKYRTEKQLILSHMMSQFGKNFLFMMVFIFDGYKHEGFINVL